MCWDHRHNHMGTEGVTGPPTSLAESIHLVVRHSVVCFCLNDVSATSGRMTLTGSAADEKDSKPGAIDLNSGDYCFSFFRYN